jgi:hypothetical protein
MLLVIMLASVPIMVSLGLLYARQGQANAAQRG